MTTKTKTQEQLNAVRFAHRELQYRLAVLQHESTDEDMQNFADSALDELNETMGMFYDNIECCDFVEGIAL